MATNGDKDTIYIDIDDEITGVIDKVRASQQRIVALVLPKRATVFQSIVNMKLLKRSADEAKKHVVLITSEVGLLPMAGSVGLYVAKNLQSKPEVPMTPELGVADEATEEAVSLDNSEPSDFDPDLNANKSVGELERGEPVPAKPLSGVETLELDNSEPDTGAPTAVATDAAAEAAKKAGGKDKKLKIPNFNRFRLRLLLGIIILLILIGLFIVATKVLPKATIDVKTDAQAINSSLDLTLDTQANSLQPDQNIVPAKAEQEQKTNTQTVPATGQKNEGNLATGTINMTTQECAPNLGNTPDPVAAGTGVSANGQTYITQQAATFNFSGFSNGNCANYQASGVPITAQNPGKQYNTNNAGFSVAGRPDVSASGSASGGSDNIVKVVQQSDIDSAKQKLESQNATSVKQDLKQQLQQDGMFAIIATFNPGTPQVTTSANAGDPANNVTVTEAITYTMYGAKRSDLDQLIDNDVKSQINTSDQTILSEGLDSAVFKVMSSTATSEQVSMSATATAGPDLNADKLKQEVAGKKSGDIQDIIKNNPGVTAVDVHFSPFWVNSAPSNPSKITIKFAKPAPPANNNGSNSG